jgi:predicted transcriptional regulator
MANLSFSFLEKYLDVALCAGFVRVENSKFELTEPGREFLSSIDIFTSAMLRRRSCLTL